MALTVCLLRGVNLGGHNKVAMADLRRLCADLGFENPQTLLNSGNVLFDAGRKAPAQLERLLETEARKRIGIETEFFIRTSEEWGELIAGNPFAREAIDDPGRLLAFVLKDPVGSREVASLQKAITGPEVVRGKGKHVYITFPAGQGQSRLTTAVIDSRLGTRGTGRNWNTVVKIAHLVCR